MSNCSHCSAPANRTDVKCQYCSSRLEVDFHSGLDSRKVAPDEERLCPHCNIKLTTFDLNIDGAFLVEKCDQCHGLFFDSGELEMVMAQSVTNIYKTDDEKLEQLRVKANNNRGEIKYIPCPVCRELMHRKLFAYRSGVIVDTCAAHGYWLDEGELNILRHWKKAGGEMLAKRHESTTAKPQSPTANIAINMLRNQQHNRDLVTELKELASKILRPW